LSKKAKDIGSAIVMITIICVCALWIGIIFLE
jgi:diacylglycerol kinase